MSYTLGGVTKTIQDNGIYDGKFIDNSNRVVFTGLSGVSFSVTGNAIGPRSAINGLSIVPDDPITIDVFTASDQYVSLGEPPKIPDNGGEFNATALRKWRRWLPQGGIYQSL